MAALRAYVEVLKPRETSLLVFVALCSALVASEGQPDGMRLLVAMFTVSLGCAGVNGLTNYLDRNVDARMRRTRERSLPAKRIDPPEKALIWTGGLTIAALVMAWSLHPYAFAAGVIGIGFSVVWRKSVACPFLRAIASLSPVIIAWIAFRPEFSLPLLLLCLLICTWVPIHVWSVMLAHREDYLGGGVKYFPLSRDTAVVVKILLLLTLPLLAVSIAVFFRSDLGWLYLTVAVPLGIGMLYANSRLIITRSSYEAWRVYKLSAFPYLGVLFLAMGVDALIR